MHREIKQESILTYIQRIAQERLRDKTARRITEVILGEEEWKELQHEAGWPYNSQYVMALQGRVEVAQCSERFWETLDINKVVIKRRGY